MTGAGESGKSTVVKQMKILHVNGFSNEYVHLLSYVAIICVIENVYKMWPIFVVIYVTLYKLVDYLVI